MVAAAILASGVVMSAVAESRNVCCGREKVEARAPAGAVAAAVLASGAHRSLLIRARCASLM